MKMVVFLCTILKVLLTSFVLCFSNILLILHRFNTSLVYCYLLVYGYDTLKHVFNSKSEDFFTTHKVSLEC